MTLPTEYLATAIQAELDIINIRARSAERLLILVPLEFAPVGAKDGWIAMSDGSGGGFDSVSGTGLYRYLGAVWVFIG